MGRENRRTRWMSALDQRIKSFFTGSPAPERVAPFEVDLIFADDSRQLSPSRPGMGSLIAIGGISVPADFARPLQQDIEGLCAGTGFPPGTSFKWSPDRQHWMRENLIGRCREDFFVSLVELLGKRDAIVTVVVADTTCGSATNAPSADLDVTTLFLERANHQLTRQGAHGLIVADRPGGGRGDEEAFLASCLDTIQSGTKYVLPDRILHNVLTTPSRLSRLVQAADVVTGCTLAAVAGETRYAPRVFSAIRGLFDHDSERIGGIGLKLHPDGKYANLYHWLVGDARFWKKGSGNALPLADRPYALGPFLE